MTGTDILTAERRAAQASLTPVVSAFEFLPARFSPPCAIVTPGAPYLTPGETFGEHTLNLDVTLIVPPGDNKGMTTALDGLICRASARLATDGWAVGDVEQPVMLRANNAEYLAATLSISTPIILTNETE